MRRLVDPTLRLPQSLSFPTVMFPVLLVTVPVLAVKALLVFLLLLFARLLIWLVNLLVITPPFDPLRNLPGPTGSMMCSHFGEMMDPNISQDKVEEWTEVYGKTFRFHGFGKFDYRLLTFDLHALSHVLKSPIYEKPWITRTILSKWLGRGLSVMEGAEHALQRKIIGPAFTAPSVRALTPIFFQKAEELRDRWESILSQGYDASESLPPPWGTVPSGCSNAIINIAHWTSRAVFDVIGLAGFDYHFHALHDDSEEVYLAYHRMFRAIDKGPGRLGILQLYFPILEQCWPNECTRITKNSLHVIHKAGKKLIEDKKLSILAEKCRMQDVQDKDMLSLLMKSNLATDPTKRLSDAVMLDQLSTLIFAGTDTTALSISYCLHTLSLYPEIQTRLRDELISLSLSPPSRPRTPASVCSETSSTHSLVSYADSLDALPLLDNVVREVLRLTPPVHSTIRVATADDLIPVSHPVVMRDGSIVRAGEHIPIRKGSYIHIPIEGLNMSEDIWGKTARSFDPDRWNNLPPTAVGRPPTHPGLANLMTFSFGPHSCPGYRFSIMETKVFLATLLPHFVFEPVENIKRFNAILTRPYVENKEDLGSRLPVRVKRYVH